MLTSVLWYSSNVESILWSNADFGISWLFLRAAKRLTAASGLPPVGPEQRLDALFRWY